MMAISMITATMMIRSTGMISFAKTVGPLPYTPKDHSEAHTNSTPDGFTDGAGKRGSWT